MGLVFLAFRGTNAPNTPAGVATQALLPQEKHPEVDFSVSCTECHREATPEIVAQWENSKHGLVNVKCYVCHGDGEVEFSPKPTSDRCVGCHSRYEVDFSKLAVKSCFSCHHGHTLKFHN